MSIYYQTPGQSVAEVDSLFNQVDLGYLPEDYAMPSEFGGINEQPPKFLQTQVREPQPQIVLQPQNLGFFGQFFQPTQQIPSQQSKPSSDKQLYDSVKNLSFREMLDKYGEGKIRVTTWNLRAPNASFGVKNSWHKQAHKTWKNADGSPMPMAYDLSPTKGHSFQDLWQLLAKPEWQYWLAAQDNGRGGKGWGVVDETTPEIRAKNPWRSTGNHIHLGAGASAWKQYVAAMNKYTGTSVQLDPVALAGMRQALSSRKGGVLIRKALYGMQVPTTEEPDISGEFSDYLGNPSTYHIYDPVDVEINALSRPRTTVSHPQAQIVSIPQPIQIQYAQSQEPDVMPQQPKQDKPIGDNISEDMFANLLKMEGAHANASGRLVAHAEKKDFGESFVTGPYGMVYKYDANGNNIGGWKEGETTDEASARENARRSYLRRYKKWQQLLAGKEGVNQDRIDALVSASGGTAKATKRTEEFVLGHWGDWEAIDKFLRTHAVTAAGNGKVQPGLVLRRHLEADWFKGIHKDWRWYQHNRHQFGI